MPTDDYPPVTDEEIKSHLEAEFKRFWDSIKFRPPYLSPSQRQAIRDLVEEDERLALQSAEMEQLETDRLRFQDEGGGQPDHQE